MKNISPIEAANILKEHKGAVLVDVRTPGEVSEEAIPGAKHIPLDELSSRLSELDGFSSLLFLCRSGGRSSVAASIAQSANLPGVTDIMNVSGGIISWSGSGLPTVSGGKFSRGFAHKSSIVVGSIVALGVLTSVMIIANPSASASPTPSESAALSAPQFGSLPAAKFAEAIASDEVKILDVRTSSEYAYGYIAGATNIDFYDDRFRDNLNALDKNAKYYIYCRSGSRTGNTLSIMRELGFTHVYDLKGGLVDWQNKGYPIER